MSVPVLVAAALLAVVLVVIPAAAREPAAPRELAGESRASRVPLPEISAPGAGHESARRETLWIFDADFEDMTGDNAGWLSIDRSGTLGQENYWHKDTIRINGFEHLGDSTWWCGTYDECWVQPRGYGNNWYQLLWRDFPLSEWSGSGDTVTLEWDQRFAMEKDYDYGFVEISTNAGSTWTTIGTYQNPGFQGPGISQDWDSANYGHPLHDLGAYAGSDIRLRFRFESDEAYSAEDETNHPSLNPVLDGAWQLDNITWKVNDTTVWLDDCESPGDNGWVHDDIPDVGQTGVVFYRGLYGTDFDVGRPEACVSPTGWMMGATDPFTGTMVDGQETWLLSPPIDISGAEQLVGLWDMWVDLPFESNDRFDLWLGSADSLGCIRIPSGFIDESPGNWSGGPFWGTWSDDWDAFAGHGWLSICWQLYNREPAEPGTHRAGIFLNRQKLGIPSGDAGTLFDYGDWDRFADLFPEQLSSAMTDSAIIKVSDSDNITTVLVVASCDAGDTWESYPCRRLDPLGNDWSCSPPTDQMSVGSEILYYFEAVDGVGNVATHPENAPEEHLEFSILPITASASEPGILLVDKHGRGTPGERRDYAHDTQHYYREALGILGHEWDVFDVTVPSGTAQSEGPIATGYQYYDTIIWLTSNATAFTFWDVDQINIMNWLEQAESGEERNLLITGNDWAAELAGTGAETLGFVSEWLTVEYIQDAIGVVDVDSLPVLKDSPGGHRFMNNDDRACVLRGWCPEVEYFDVIGIEGAAEGAEVAVLYEKTDATELPAGVAYTEPTIGYQTVALGFGMEFMMDSIDPSTGYYRSGAPDRVDLMQNIMEYFAKSPTTDPTGVADENFRNMFAGASPNPFNPVTKIAYSVREAGPVTIGVYNIAGRVVRTLLRSELAAGAEGFVVWDGTDDAGKRCASGVYFCRMTAPGFAKSRKMVMLK